MTARPYICRWRLGQDRRGQPCRVVCRGSGDGPRNILVEFADGARIVTIWRALRRVR